MSKGFEGSVVLTQNSPGHCSISGPSLCTQKYIISGKLPPPGTVCEVDTTPFSDSVTAWSLQDRVHQNGREKILLIGNYRAQDLMLAWWIL
ncbi:hypothetical protein CPC08DRAFT_675877 [Agrocybe pediades]|nr:hypothetical protein CPC08DRAFT_675877 [Agrocybe pediades]